MWSIKFFCLNARHWNIVAVHVFNYFQMLYNANIIYMEYLCNVSCRTSWIFFNQHVDLVIINDCWPAGTFSVFSIKFSLLCLANHLRTIPLVWRQLDEWHMSFLLFVYHIFFFLEIKDHQMTKMLLIFIHFQF